MMPAGSSFMRAHPPLHEIADVRMLTKGKEESLKEYKRFLVAFLQDVSGTKLAYGCQKVSSDVSMDRVATAQGKQGIWFLLFPDRENTGNFVVTQGKFLRHR